VGPAVVARLAAAALTGALALTLTGCGPSRPDLTSAAEAARPDPATVGDGVVVTPTGVIAPVLSTFPGGFWIRTPCYRVAAIRGGQRLDQADIVLDPGHGGPEPGAVSPSGIREEDLNLAVTRRVADRLQGLGISVVLTRSWDQSFVTLKTRAEIARALEPKAFVSIHHNAGTTDPSPVPGTESYHQLASADGQRLARHLYDEVFATFERYDAPWYNPTGGVKTRQGENGDYYGILRFSAGTPAAIIEAAFVSNEPEAQLLVRDDVQDAEADAITRAILRWLREPRTGGVLVETGAPPVDWAAPAGDDEGCVDPRLD
jgi:N-acetylmuramoyl-L-alanine amidase